VKAAVFKKIPDRGLEATVTTNAQNKVTEITLTGLADNGLAPVLFPAVEDIKGHITKIGETSVTVKNADNKDGKAYDLARECKFYRQVKDAKVEIKEGVKAAVFKNIPEKGLEATVTTNALNRVTEITLTAAE
jgi:hypothetical protein